MKKLLSFLLAMLLIISVVPLGAFSFTASALADGYYVYSVSDGKATITSVNTSISGDVTIPNTLGGYTVTSIGYKAFYNCESLKSITIPDSVTNIGTMAFEGCKSLTSITIPDSVTSIGNYAFYKCTSLTSITIPDSVTSIGSNAFYNTAYYNDVSNLENDVLYIGNHLINAKTNIIGEYTVKSGTITIADSAFEYCSSLTSITIPDSVTRIGSYAFDHCTGLTSITIPDSVTSIGYSAFSGCTGLTSITIPDSVTSIGNSAFYNCSSLTSITIPDSVTSIGECTFYYCTNLTSITIPVSVTSIGESAFCGCTSLTSITIPDSVISIGEYAFYNCTSLTDVYYGGSWVDYTNISIARNNECLTNATWHYAKDDTLKYSYDDTTLTATVIGCMPTATNVVIPSTVVKDETTYTVTSVGSRAFEGCKSLTSITIPDSVISIGEYAFYNCTSLTDVYYGGSWVDYTNLSIEWNNECLTNATWHYVKDDTLKYSYDDTTLTATVIDCMPTATNVVIPSTVVKDETTYTVTSIGSSVFFDCTSLTSITIPDGVTSIGSCAFYNCSSLTSITIPDRVTSIGNDAFYNCDSLTSIIIPKGVSVLCAQVFGSCDNLTNITLPNNISIVENSAFSNCTMLTDVWYMGSEDRRGYIGIYGGNDDLLYSNWHFNSCIDSADHKYDNGCDTVCNICDFVREPVHNYNSKNICDDCGYNKLLDYIEYEIENGEAIIIYCDYSIQGDFVIPREIDGYTVTSIEKNAFFMCRRLKNITIPDSITNIGDWAFDYCYGLTNIYYQGDESQKSEIVIGEGNLDLSNATWHYNQCIVGENHVYNDDNDDSCNNCGFVRDISKTEAGDTNGDGKINGKDYAMLLQSINGWDITIDSQAADVNADGRLNGKDYALLLQSINGWDVELK